MADVVLCFSPSVNASYKKNKPLLAASQTAVLNKLQRVEPQVLQALVRYGYEQARAIGNHLRTGDQSDITGYRTKILDGNHLSGSEHRIHELRTERAAVLPGKSLVVLDPRLRLIQDYFPILDGHAQERTRISDPLVGRDILLGILTGVLGAICEQLSAASQLWQSGATDNLLTVNPVALVGPIQLVGSVLHPVRFGLFFALIGLVMLIFCRAVLITERRAILTSFLSGQRLLSSRIASVGHGGPCGPCPVGCDASRVYGMGGEFRHLCRRGWTESIAWKP